MKPPYSWTGKKYYSSIIPEEGAINITDFKECNIFFLLVIQLSDNVFTLLWKTSFFPVSFWSKESTFSASYHFPIGAKFFVTIVSREPSASQNLFLQKKGRIILFFIRLSILGQYNISYGGSLCVLILLVAVT